MSTISGQGNEQVYTVSELTDAIHRILKLRLSFIQVSGEISNSKKSPNGHLYFTLKDKDAVLNCVCFRRDAQSLDTLPEDGISVVVQGSLGVYKIRGQYQLIAVTLRPHGLGNLYQAFLQLKKKLESEGLFDQERKQAMPTMPRRIGIVSSPKGAVIHDMHNVLRRRFPGLHIKLYPTSVQGDAAPAQIVGGIQYFNQNPWAEVVIIARGGGSLEDLWAFNDEKVARAIAASAVPLVSAVGHETDFTIADFVADMRAPTPSAAAEIVVPDVQALRRTLAERKKSATSAFQLLLAGLARRLRECDSKHAAHLLERRLDREWQYLEDNRDGLYQGIQAQLRFTKQRLEASEKKLTSLDIRVRLVRQAKLLDSAVQRIKPAMKSRLGQESSRIRVLAGTLSALSPLSILDRGYSIVEREDGVPVRESAQVTEGDSLHVRLHQGALGVRVENKDPVQPERTKRDKS